MGPDLKLLRHPDEVSRFWLALIVVIPLTLLFLLYTALTFGLILIVIYLLFLFMRNMVYTIFIGNSLRVDEHNFPEIHQISEEVRANIGYDKEIDIFIYEEGSFNAFLVPFLKKRAVILNSETVHGASGIELRWLIGRFVGYLKGKKMRFMWFEIFLNGTENAQIFNLFLYPYERAAVLTGDRIGAYAAGYDADEIMSAMNKLLVGPDISYRVQSEGLAKQNNELRGKPIFSFLTRLGTPFPHMMRRYAEMAEFLMTFDRASVPAPHMGPPGTRPGAAPKPGKMDHQFKREAPFKPEAQTAKPAQSTHAQAFQTSSVVSTPKKGPGFFRVLLGLIAGGCVMVGIDILTFGMPDGFPPATTLLWLEDFEDPTIALSVLGIAVGGMLTAHIVGGGRVVPPILFVFALVWTVATIVTGWPFDIGSFEDNAAGFGPGALVFGGVAGLTMLIPRFT